MSITVEQVRCWFPDAGIGHAVHKVDTAGVWTACGRWYVGERLPDSLEERSKRPSRICARCREMLKHANPIGGDK